MIDRDELAAACGLSERQRRWADAWLAGDASARRATAAKISRMARVQNYIAAINANAKGQPQ